MRFIDDMDLVWRRVATEEWAAALIRAARADAAGCIDRFDDSPSRVSGWGHDYVCASCSSRLIFDISKPREHVCSSCGRVNTEDKHHAVWVATYRGRVAAALFSAGVLYRLEGDERLLRFIRETLLFYADHYDEFEVHGGWVAKGKIMWQSLEEATFAISLMRTVELVRDSLDAETMAGLHRGLFRPLALFIAGQPEHLLNIRLWIRSAVAMAGLVFGDAELEQLGLEGEGGVRDLLAQALTADSLWIEGSLHYHFYALNGLTELCHVAAIRGRPIQGVDSAVRGAYRVPLELAYRDLSFPTPNDGWPDIGVANYLAQYELAQKLFPDPQIAAALSRLLADPARRRLTTLLFVPADILEAAKPPPPRERSLHLDAMSFVKLCRDDLSVFFRYGYRTKAHAHFDRMGIEIFGWSPDPSNVGYGTPLHGEWYMSTVAHNTVVVDGRNQDTFHPGECLDFGVDHVRARASEVYPGVSFERDLRIGDRTLEDTFSCGSAEHHLYDWVFHVRGELASPAAGEAARLGYAENGYQHLSEVRRITGPTSFTWRRKDGETLHVTIDLSGVPEAEVYTFSGIGNPPTERWPGVLVRARGASATFRAKLGVTGA